MTCSDHCCKRFKYRVCLYNIHIHMYIYAQCFYMAHIYSLGLSLPKRTWAAVDVDVDAGQESNMKDLDV